VPRKGIQLDAYKVEAIKSGPIQLVIMEVQSFHRMTFFHHQFIKVFSSIIAPLTKCMKKGSLEWTKAVEREFEAIEDR